MSLLPRLKSETRAHHARIESSVRLLDSGLTSDGYRRHLELSYGFHLPVEARLLALLGDALPELRMHERSKESLLEADLRALGHDFASLALLPRCSRPPSLPGLPEALGGCYVLEGSTLGGQVLLRHLRTHFEGTPVGDFAFLRAYGDEVGTRWRAFGGVLTRAATQADDAGFDDRVVKGAQDTFDAFDAWLRQ